MEPITDIPTYLRAHAQELGNRILESYPPLHSIDDPPSPMIGKLLRKPYAAQTARHHGSGPTLAAGPGRGGDCNFHQLMAKRATLWFNLMAATLWFNGPLRSVAAPLPAG